MENNPCYKKLDEDDILEILVEHFQCGELKNFSSAQACLFGTPGKDLRFIGVFSNGVEGRTEYDMEKVDRDMDYNGDHSFLKKHSEFWVKLPISDDKNKNCN